MNRNLGPIYSFIILIFLILQGVSAFAHDKIVLLTSLDPAENRPPLRSQRWNINEKLEERFLKDLKKMLKKREAELTPVVKHFSTAEDLFLTLQDENVKAIVWVGHAGFSEGEGISQTKTIIDFKGRDLKNLFQLAGPHLRYLALVGCRGKLFLNEWKKEGWFKETPHLKTFGREVKTDARKGLRLAMDELEDHFKKNRHFLDFPILSKTLGKDQLQITRTNREEGKMESVQIFQRGKLIGFLPSSEDDQSIVVNVDLAQTNVENKIISDSGYSALGKKEINMGFLDIENEDNQWKLFQTATGKPIGVGRHIYRHTITQRR